MGSRKDPNKRYLNQLIGRAEWVLRVEKIWPQIAAALSVLAGFLGVVWLGWLALLPDLARWGVIVLVAGALVFVVSAARRFSKLSAQTSGRREPRISNRDQAIKRIEHASALKHQPLAALEDSLTALPSGTHDGAANETKALWAAHQARMKAQLKALKTGAPNPRFFALDVFALRAIAGILFVCGLVFGNGDYTDRLSNAFAITAEDPRPLRVDIWANPPSYTNRAPLVLSFSDQVMGEGAIPSLFVPEGSELTVRIQGSRDLRPLFIDAENGSSLRFEAPEAGENVASWEEDPPLVYQTRLDASGTLSILDEDRTMASWQLSIVEDESPSIQLTEDPLINLNDTFKFTYALEDDHGIASAFASYRPLDIGVAEDARPLVKAPDHALPLPSNRTRTGTASTTRSLMDHPLAGSTVEVTLSATDQAGQVGYSEPFELALPSRVFRKPLARALVDQRRRLALDARRQIVVLEAVDALLIAPELFSMDYGAYLGLQLVQTSLVDAQDDDALREVLAQIWDLALTIEDGDLTNAERNLRDAQEALRRALENGASDEEIARLTEELREAMREYLQALAENAQRRQQMGEQQQPLDGQEMQTSDLDRMLDQIQELAQSGARDAAQQMLSQLQQMLDNMRTAQQQQMQNGQQNQMSQAMQELSEIIRRQRELMDQTFRQQQQGQQGQRGQNQQGQNQQGMGQQPGGNQPMTPEQMAEALRQLQDQQNALSQRLEELRQQLGEMGLGEEQGSAFGDAGEAMGRAEGALQEGAPGQAVGPQGQALDALRRGIDQLAEAMQNGPGSQPGQQSGRGQANRDPLGRPRRTEGPDFGEATKVPDEIDIQRARRVLEELRRRLSNPDRPQLELDYLERLLERF